jgi:ElaB/YqjD/DUF883 family membrane-anchored ribosome-binding protein
MMINRLQPTTDILDHTRDLKRAATTVAGDLHDEAANQFAGLRDTATRHFSDVRGRASDSWDTLKGLVRKHPIAAVGIGLAAGLLLAAAWARRD